MDRKSFLDLPAPPNYVAGIGRGATGFTTRSDLGPAKTGFASTLNQQVSDNEDEDEDGNKKGLEDSEKGLLVTGETQDQDDEEADRIYELIEARLQNKRKRSADNDEDNDDEGQASKMQRQQQQEMYDNISSQFADLKKGLSAISEEQWLNLPEAGDMTKRNKRERELAKQQRRTYNVSDSLLSGLRDQEAVDNAVEADTNQLEDMDTNFEMISSARGQMLSSKLGGSGDASNPLAATRFDAKNYLLQLEQGGGNGVPSDEVSAAVVGDIAKSRAIFKSLRTTEPYNPIHWISSARIEVQARKFDQAKKIIQEGCKKCHNDEGIWLENIAINTSNIVRCKQIVAEALTFNLKSEKLWIKAIDLETDVFARKKVIKKALSNKSDSINLWRIAINTEENKEDAKQLIKTAIEIIPDSIELWLALVDLEENVREAKKILNNARKNLPASHEIWIVAGKLEEKSTGNEVKVEKLLQKGISEVIVNGSTLSRNDWLAEAISCENAGFPVTAVSVVKNCLSLGLENADSVDKIITWQDDAERASSAGNFHMAKAIYKRIIGEYPQELPVWRTYFEFLKKYSTVAELYEAFEQSIKVNPSLEEFWLRFAKEKWVNGDVDAARSILNDAFKKNSNRAEIWLAAVKLESSNRQYRKALELLQGARAKIADDPRMWYKAVTLQRQLGNNDQALELVEEALRIFPDVDKLHMQKGQIYEDLGMVPNAREAFATGVRVCETSIPLWRLLVNNFMKDKLVIRARSALDRAMVKNPKSDELWVARIGLERQVQNHQGVRNMVNLAYQKFPQSPLVWAEKLRQVEKKTEMKKLLLQAMKETNSDPVILLAIGVNFYADGKYEKARAWFERAIATDRDNGDAWCWMYIFYKRRNMTGELQELVKDFKIAEPKHGNVWSSVHKNVRHFEKSMVELLEAASAKLLG